jgi:hypothetical protein
MEKEGKRYTFVKLADEDTFDSNEFMLHREHDNHAPESQKRYTVTLDVEGKFTSVKLEPEGYVKPKAS